MVHAPTIHIVFFILVFHMASLLITTIIMAMHYSTADYACLIFDEALTKGAFNCYLRPDTLLPMIYIDDCLRAIVEMMEVPDEHLKLRTYNIAALSFTPTQLVEEVKKHIPDFETLYKPDDRQAIGEAQGTVHKHLLKLNSY